MIYKHGNTSNYLYFIPCKTLYCLQSFINSFYHESFHSNKRFHQLLRGTVSRSC